MIRDCRPFRRRVQECLSSTSKRLADVSFRVWRDSLAAAVLLAGVGAIAAIANGPDQNIVPVYQEFSDSEGRFANFNTGGPTEMRKNAFFEDLGTNGRRCVTCHQPSDAWSVTPKHIQARFEATRGTDPIFRTNDGSGCPTQDVSTLRARRDAYSLLLNRGLIRVEINIPEGAEFTVMDNDNPYGCDSTTAISEYRRPLPATNLPYLSTVMWDGRETLKNDDGTFLPVTTDLAHQAVDATTGHAQGAVPPPDKVQEIIDFETKIFTAQTHDRDAGDLDDNGADGGPRPLSKAGVFYRDQ